jgi:hypothetical protein
MKAEFEVSIITRIKLAWYAFWLQDYECVVKPFTVLGDTIGIGVKCDNKYRTGCTNIATTALYQGIVRIKCTALYENSYFVCPDCSTIAIEKNSKEQ